MRWLTRRVERWVHRHCFIEFPAGTFSWPKPMRIGKHVVIRGHSYAPNWQKREQS
jgi:hypothetical protein